MTDVEKNMRTPAKKRKREICSIGRISNPRRSVKSAYDLLTNIARILARLSGRCPLF